MFLSSYDLVRCPTCGFPWDEHPADCPNHRHRPVGPTVAVLEPPRVLIGVDNERGFNLILHGDHYIVEPKPGTDWDADNPFVFKKL